MVNADNMLTPSVVHAFNLDRQARPAADQQLPTSLGIRGERDATAEPFAPDRLRTFSVARQISRFWLACGHCRVFSRRELAEHSRGKSRGTNRLGTARVSCHSSGRSMAAPGRLATDGLHLAEDGRLTLDRSGGQTPRGMR